MKIKKIIVLLFVFLIIIFSSINANSKLIPDITEVRTNNNIKNNNDTIPLSELIAQVNSTTLRKYIQDIESFGPHPTGSSTIEKVKKYLFNKLSNFTNQITYHHWEYKDKKGDNIIVTIKGQSNPEGLVIACAHYDTIEVSPGADDDGSGVASILMMAEILTKYNHNSTIQLILFSGEEQGLLGSKKYVEELSNQNIIGVLALDKIGYAKTTYQGKTIRHHADPASSWMQEITEEISKKYIDEINLKIEKLPFDGSSDHKAFVDIGYPGSNLVEETLNPYYHTSEDLIKHMNITYLKKVCQLATCTIASIAQGNSNLTNDDIEITVKGKNYNEYQAKLSIIIKNKKYNIDTANLSITIEMSHLLRETPVHIKKEYYQTPCIWNFIEEIEKEWYFNIGQQTYSIGFFILKISVHGLYDDFPISKKYSKFGLIFPEYNLIISNNNIKL
jgi:hypothetical protein